MKHTYVTWASRDTDDLDSYRVYSQGVALRKRNKSQPFWVDNNEQEVTAKNSAKINLTYATADKFVQR